MTVDDNLFVTEFAMKKILLAVLIAAAVVAILGAGPAQNQNNVPHFEVDPRFPQLPAGKVLGDMSSVAVDSHDHVWMIQRPRTGSEAQRTNAAPPLLGIDETGKVLGGWGGAGAGFGGARR